MAFNDLAIVRPASRTLDRGEDGATKAERGDPMRDGDPRKKGMEEYENEDEDDDDDDGDDDDDDDEEDELKWKNEGRRSRNVRGLRKMREVTRTRGKL